MKKLLCALVCATLIAACCLSAFAISNDTDLLGTWNTTYSDNGDTLYLTFTFNSDATVDIVRLRNGSEEFNTTGTYKTSKTDGVLQITLTTDSGTTSDANYYYTLSGDNLYLYNMESRDILNCTREGSESSGNDNSSGNSNDPFGNNNNSGSSDPFGNSGNSNGNYGYSSPYGNYGYSFPYGNYGYSFPYGGNGSYTDPYGNSGDQQEDISQYPQA